MSRLMYATIAGGDGFQLTHVENRLMFKELNTVYWTSCELPSKRRIQSDQIDEMDLTSDHHEILRESAVVGQH